MKPLLHLAFSLAFSSATYGMVTDPLYNGIIYNPAAFSDSAMKVSNLDVRNLEAREENNYHYLQWDASNNQFARSYSVEVSYDNINFTRISDIAPRPEGGDTHYQFSYPVLLNNQPLTLYRIKVINNAGNISYSNLAIIRNEKRVAGNMQMVIFPNPGEGNFKVATYSNGKAQTRYEVFSFLGRSVAKGTIFLEDGLNHADLHSLAGLPSGVYVVVFYTKRGMVSQKVVVKK